MPIDRNDPEVIALIEEVTAAATDALATKNRELLGEVKTLKAKAKNAEIDPEEHQKLLNRVDELTDSLAKTSKTSNAEIDKLTKQITEKDGALQTHLIDAALTDSLVKAGVQAPLMDAVKALHKGKAVINVADGQYQSLIDGKPIADFITSWAQSDQGKHFVSAPANNGGGSQGGGRGAGAKQMTRAEYSQMQTAGDSVSLAAFFKEGGVVVD